MRRARQPAPLTAEQLWDLTTEAIRAKYTAEIVQAVRAAGLKSSRAGRAERSWRLSRAMAIVFEMDTLLAQEPRR